MTSTKMLAALGMFATLWLAASPAQEARPDMTYVKYDGLKQEVLKHRGKVVVVDFWAGW